MNVPIVVFRGNTLMLEQKSQNVLDRFPKLIQSSFAFVLDAV